MDIEKTANAEDVIQSAIVACTARMKIRMLYSSFGTPKGGGSPAD